jgi:hypothetical protein
MNSDVNLETRQMLIEWFQNYSKKYKLIGQIYNNEKNVPQLNLPEKNKPLKEVNNVWFYILEKSKK